MILLNYRITVFLWKGMIFMNSNKIEVCRKLAEIELDYVLQEDFGEKKYIKYGLDVAREFAHIAGIYPNVCETIKENAKIVGNDEKDFPSNASFESLVDKILRLSSI